MKTIFRDIQPVANASFTIHQERATQFGAPFHFHKGYELLFIIKGQGKFYGGNQVMNFGSGDVYLFGPNFPHYFVNDRTFVESGETGHSIIIQFRDGSLEEVFAQLPELSAVNELLKAAVSGVKFSQVGETILALPFQMLKSKNSGFINLLHFMHALYLLASSNRHLMTTIDPAPAPSLKKLRGDSRLDDVYQYVLTHFSEELTTQHAASLSCMQEAAFCRYFKRRTQKTFSQFVNTVRITHATHLLAKTDGNISEICFSCGFNSVSYFNRQFKSIVGVTPLEYRKTILEDDVRADKVLYPPA
jgi:AraC-like DNA-binding protein